MPIYDKKSRLVTSRISIALKYIRTWFLIDTIALTPFSYFRKVSASWPNSKDDLRSFLTMNYSSVPRFYKIVMFI